MAYQHYRSPFGDTTFTKVFVGGLAWETHTDVMREYFEQFGEILEAVIITDKNTGKSKGYGFVTFRDAESARRACAEANPVIDGRKANCNIASLGRPRPSPPRGREQGYHGEGVPQGASSSYSGVPAPLAPPLPPPPGPVIYPPYGKSNRRVPGPRGLPLIGNMHQFDSINTHVYLHQLAKKYGPLMSLQLGSVQILVISSASAAREVFKYHDLCFSNRPTSVGTDRLSYNNLGFIFAPYDDYWRSMRKFSALHLFNSKRSQSFQPIRDEEIARMVKEIRDGAAADDTNVVDLSKALMNLTSSVIFRITFGKRYDEDEEDCAENENSMSSKFHWLIRETQANFVSFFLEDYFPLMGRLIDSLNGAWTRLEKSFSETDAFYQQLIDKHIRASSVSSAGDCSSILDILLQMKKDSSDFTFDHIKAILMNFIVAATDTSAAAAVWTMTLLIKNPVSMKKVQQELRDFAREKGYVDENDIQKLVYLKAVVKEAMRLQPPAPLLHRETIEKCELSGYDIEAKTCVYINTYAIGRDPECWENPDEFSPERFINTKIDFKGQDYELIPFGAGRRICPGISMGAMTTELVVANLFYSFDWELPPGISTEDIDMATLPGLTFHKKNHLCLVPKIID